MNVTDTFLPGDDLRGDHPGFGAMRPALGDVAELDDHHTHEP
jgi:hypothetical protein